MIFVWSEDTGFEPNIGGGDRKPGRNQKRARRSRIRRDQATVPARLELHSFYAPKTECIGKGKASAPYEFGVKVSIVTTNACAPGRSVRATCQGAAAQSLP